MSAMSDPAPGTTMTAWLTDSYGPARFRRATVSRPVPGSGETLIAVAATSVNPVDVKLADGAAPGLAPPLPAILHMDVAGTVAAVGAGVDHLKIGDKVYGCAGGLGDLQGALADFMPADARLVAPAPAGLDLRAAAALPLAIITAFEGLHWKARIEAGEHVLVHGGAGGVGHLAVQVAKAAGAVVTATASSPEKQAIVRRFGADHVVDYRCEQPDAYVQRLTGGRGFDLVFDAAGGDALVHAFAATRANGRIVSIQSRGQHDLGAMMPKALSLHVIFMLLPMLTGEGRKRHGAILADAAALVEQGRLKPLLDPAFFTFDEVEAAHARLRSNQHLGKIVLTHPH